MSDKGIIYTYSIIYVPTEEFKAKAPYVIAIVADEAGTKNMAMIEGYREGLKINIGDELVLAGRDASGNPVYKFVQA